MILIVETTRRIFEEFLDEGIVGYNPKKKLKGEILRRIPARSFLKKFFGIIGGTVFRAIHKETLRGIVGEIPVKNRKKDSFKKSVNNFWLKSVVEFLERSSKYFLDEPLQQSLEKSL